MKSSANLLNVDFVHDSFTILEKCNDFNGLNYYFFGEVIDYLGGLDKRREWAGRGSF